MPLPQPAPMEGHGAYNRNSAVQAAGIARALEQLQAAAADVPLPPAEQMLILADYGSAQGHNSLAPVQAAIAALRRRTAPGRAIQVFHTDLPGNDWAALFDTLAADPASYLANDPAVFPAAIGRSFLLPLLPPGSVTLGWSSWALHWLARAPAPIPDHLHIACSRDAAARAAFAAEAEANWRAFLSARAAELRPGARLVLLFRASENHFEDSYMGLFEAAWRAVRDLAREGFLTQQELTSMAIPSYGRTRAEIAAPFEAGAFQGLHLDGLDIVHGDDPIWTETDHGTDKAAYAARWAAFFRAAAFPSLAVSVAGDAARRAAFLDRAERAMRPHLQADIRSRRMPLACLTLRRAA